MLIASVSLAGHFALRFAGPKAGPILTGLIGGLVSSVAVAVGAARLARTPTFAAAQSGCLAAAQAVMCARALAVATVLNPTLAPVLALPLAMAAAAALVAAHIFTRRAARLEAKPGGGGERHALQPPDDLGAALAFGAVLAGVILAIQYARSWFGVSGFYGTAALAGLIDIDAITVTAASMAETSAAVAGGAILIACAVNSLVKVGIAAALGSRPFTGQVGLLIAGTLAAGAVGFAGTLL